MLPAPAAEDSLEVPALARSATSAARSATSLVPAPMLVLVMVDILLSTAGDEEEEEARRLG